MNNESDLQCTCDIGPFATCPVCQSARPKSEKAIKEDAERARYWREKREKARPRNLSPLDIWNMGRDR